MRLSSLAFVPSIFSHYLNAIFKHPPQSYPATPRHKIRYRTLMWSSWKGLWNAPSFWLKTNGIIKASVSLLFTEFLGRIRGYLNCVCKKGHSILNFPLDAVFVVPTNSMFRSHTFKIHQPRCNIRSCQLAFNVRVVPQANCQRFVSGNIQGTSLLMLVIIYVHIHDRL